MTSKSDVEHYHKQILQSGMHSTALVCLDALYDLAMRGVEAESEVERLTIERDEARKQAEADWNACCDVLRWPRELGGDLPAPSRAVKAVCEQVQRLEKELEFKRNLPAEVEALKADNAALVLALSRVVACPDYRSAGGHIAHRDAAELVKQPHPGAALLEEMRGLRAEAERLRGENSVVKQESARLRDRVARLEAHLREADTSAARAANRAEMASTRATTAERRLSVLLEAVDTATRAWCRVNTAQDGERATAYTALDTAMDDLRAAYDSAKSGAPPSLAPASTLDFVESLLESQAVNVRNAALEEAAQVAVAPGWKTRECDEVADAIRRLKKST